MNLSDQLQTKLRRSYANPHYSGWFWDIAAFWSTDDMYYQLGLDLYSDEDADWTIVCLIPMRVKRPLPYPIIPGPWHRIWAIHFLAGPDENDIVFVSGTLAEAKGQLDALLATPSPPIPPFPSSKDWQKWWEAAQQS